MAFLIAVQTANGDWHAHVVAHPSQTYCGDIDVIGRAVPAWRYVEAWDGVKKDDAVRLAQTLKGAPKARRQTLFGRGGDGGGRRRGFTGPAFPAPACRGAFWED